LPKGSYERSKKLSLRPIIFGILTNPVETERAKNMMEIAIFVVGALLVTAALVLTFLTKSVAQASISLVLGVVCILAGAGFLFSIKGGA
jgi:hypothetical protein